MHISCDEYLKKAVEWHRFNPWTVVFAREDGMRTGMSIVLPLNDRVYQEIVRGRRATYDVAPEDFASPTSKILIEACAEKPDPAGPRDPNPTKPLLMCLALQAAALCRSRDLPSSSVVRFLSFGGTPRNRDRLLDSGFKPTGTIMLKTGAELFEREIPIPSLRADSFIDSLFLIAFSTFCDRPPPT
jgi:hypothetical protein